MVRQIKSTRVESGVLMDIRYSHKVLLMSKKYRQRRIFRSQFIGLERGSGCVRVPVVA
jgi:hypothetical protein